MLFVLFHPPSLKCQPSLKLEHKLSSYESPMVARHLCNVFTHTKGFGRGNFRHSPDMATHNAYWVTNVPESFHQSGGSVGTRGRNDISLTRHILSRLLAPLHAMNSRWEEVRPSAQQQLSVDSSPHWFMAPLILSHIWSPLNNLQWDNNTAQSIWPTVSLYCTVPHLAV